MHYVVLPFAALLTFHPGAADDGPMEVGYLRCEYRVAPLGIDIARPRLSWELHDRRRGAVQTAYQVLVASSPETLADDRGDLWDSGRVESDRSVHVEYAGRALGSRTRCHWKVRVWDQHKAASAWSKPAMWTMGLLKPEDVRARWIGLPGTMVHPGKPPAIDFEGCRWIWTPQGGGADARRAAAVGPGYFRKVINIPSDRRITRAELLVTADDQFELFFDGRSRGRSDGQPDAWRRPQRIDMTHRLSPGKHCLAVAAKNTGADSPAGVTGKLVAEFDRGEPMTVHVDGSWKATDKLPPEAAEPTAWGSPQYDDSQWPAAVEIAEMGEMPWQVPGKEGMGEVLGCPLFRKEFAVAGPIRRATLYASALGVYRAYLNGTPVGNDYFTPDWTDYHKRVYYNSYDVTDLVRGGGSRVPNTIGAVLAAGWYAGAIGWKSERYHYDGQPRLFVQLEIELADGTVQTVCTDGSWKTAWGPYLEGEFLAGETYDARREIPGWAQPGLDDSAWQPVTVTDSISAKLEAFPGVTVQETGVVKPVKVRRQRPGVYVFDMGQNFAGFVRLNVRGPAATKVVMRFAEMLNPDGSIYTTNLRGARATDTYILKGRGQEIWQPRFTFHGFRYVELSGYPGKPTGDTITGIAINSATPLVGSFECSSPMVNQLQRNIVRTQRANFISVPTDCPQRDERMGWTGDAQAFIRTATYQADVGAFFTKWLVDLEDAQGPGGEFPDVAPRVVALGGGTAAWADAGVICPWTIHRVYNDRRVLENHYDAMVRWIDYCRRHSKELLRPAQGYGDWLSINADTPKDVLATAFFAYSTRLTAEVARTLGKNDEAQRHEALLEQIKQAFREAYVSADGRIKGDTQTCYVLALWFDLLSEDERQAAVGHLVEDIRGRGTRLSTGFVGTSYLLPTLSRFGHNRLAYELLLSEKFPSWGYSIKHGATSIWERWDGWTEEKGFQNPGMNSFAHYAFGAVGRWMFQTAAGIDTDGPGFQRIVIRPQPAKGLDWVKASYRSIHGRIASQWKVEQGRFLLHVAIPPNTTATVCVPAADPRQVTESGRPAKAAEGVKLLRSEPGVQVFEVGSGEYRFAADGLRAGGEVNVSRPTPPAG